SLLPISSTHILYFLILPPPPISTLFPYTTLFRSRPSPACAAIRSPSSATSSTTPTRSSAPTSRRGTTPSRGTGRCSAAATRRRRSEEHTSELQSLAYLVCRLLLEKKNKQSKR